jgi:putative oxidoreductase
MYKLSHYGVVAARILISLVFLLNGLAIIDQTIPTKELIERGVPVGLAPLIILGGRALELGAGFALAFGIAPRLAALALLAFLVPATFVSHSFWLAAGTPAFQGQLINFSKNVAIWGGLLFISGSEEQPSLLQRRKILPGINASQMARNKLSGAKA